MSMRFGEEFVWQKRNKPKGAPAQGQGNERSLITLSSIQYLGTAVLPLNLADGSQTPQENWAGGGHIAAYRGAAGLTSRTVSSTPYFIAMSAQFTGGGHGWPYRFHCSSWATSAPFPTCTVDELYGDIFDSKRVGSEDEPFDGIFAGPLGIYWDEDTDKLWWSWSANPYGDGPGTPVASLGYSTFDGSVWNGQAAYKFENSYFKRRPGPIVPVPQWFADTYFDGKRFLLCNRGYQSGTGASPDPYCIALNLPTGSHLTTVTANQIKEVVGKGSVTDCAERGDRPTWLPPLYHSIPDIDPGGCGPADILSNPQRVNWTDVQGSDMIFVDTGIKYGLLTFGAWSHGAADYIAAIVPQAGVATGMTVIDPAHLAEVYAGTRSANNVPIADSWEWQYPIHDYSAYPFVIDSKTITSAVADSTTNRFRFTFATPHGYTTGTVNTQFFIYGSAGLPRFSEGFNGGYTTATIVSPTIIDACVGQNCDYDIPTTYSEEGLTALKAAVNYQLQGVVSGAAWFATNSPCGQDNTFAIMQDSEYPTGSIRKFISCFKVN